MNIEFVSGRSIWQTFKSTDSSNRRKPRTITPNKLQINCAIVKHEIRIWAGNNSQRVGKSFSQTGVLINSISFFLSRFICLSSIADGEEAGEWGGRETEKLKRDQALEAVMKMIHRNSEHGRSILREILNDIRALRILKRWPVHGTRDTETTCTILLSHAFISPLFSSLSFTPIQSKTPGVFNHALLQRVFHQRGCISVDIFFFLFTTSRMFAKRWRAIWKTRGKCMGHV